MSKMQSCVIYLVRNTVILPHTRHILTYPPSSSSKESTISHSLHDLVVCLPIQNSSELNNNNNDKNSTSIVLGKDTIGTLAQITSISSGTQITDGRRNRHCSVQIQALRRVYVNEYSLSPEQDAITFSDSYTAHLARGKYNEITSNDIAFGQSKLTFGEALSSTATTSKDNEPQVVWHCLINMLGITQDDMPSTKAWGRIKNLLYGDVLDLVATTIPSLDYESAIRILNTLKIEQREKIVVSLLREHLKVRDTCLFIYLFNYSRVFFHCHDSSAVMLK